MSIVKAHNNNDEVNFKQYTIHLMDSIDENPFAEGTEEYDKFAEMKVAYSHHNMRRVYVVCEQLCDIVNHTEVETEKKKQTILGVIPEEKEKDRSWFKFLHPWR